MKTVFICLFCKEVFIPKDSHKNRPHPFCSSKCSGLNNSKTHPRKTDKEYRNKRYSLPGSRETKRKADRAYSACNREKLRAKASEYYLANKLSIKAKQREYSKKNKERKRQYDLVHKDKIRKNHARWCAKQRKENPIYKLHDNITSLIGLSLRTGKNGKRTEAVLGYSMTDLRYNLEKQFQIGMSWDNYGKNGWHVDHRIPLRAFNITSVNDIDFKRAWSLSNLQPLWAHENLVKNGRIEKPFQPSLALALY